MPWVKLDDHFPDHPKVDTLSDGAFRLHVAGLCHCARMLTDGFVAYERVPRLVPKFRRGQVEELVTAGVWESSDGGWSIHDYLVYNPSRAKVLADRAAAAERAQRSRERSALRAAARSRVRARPPSPPVRDGDGECLSTGDGPSAPAATGDADSPTVPQPIPPELRERFPGKRRTA